MLTFEEETELQRLLRKKYSTTSNPTKYAPGLYGDLPTNYYSPVWAPSVPARPNVTEPYMYN
jgi:hypothetical protein